MCKGRKPIQVDDSQLRSTIRRLEDDNKFTSRDALYQAIADTDFAMGAGLKKAFIYQYIRKNNIPLTTPVGERGRKKGFTVKTGEFPVKRTSRVAPPEIKEALFKRTPKEYHKLAEKVAAGSLKAIVKYNCLQCVGFQPKEVRHCGIKSCQSYSARPYKTESEKSRIPLTTVVDSVPPSDTLNLPDIGIEDSTNEFEAIYS